MKRRFVIILTILLGVSFANAQKLPLKNPLRTFHLRQPVQAVHTRITKQVQCAALKANSFVPARPVVSVTEYFHGLADGKWADLEASVPPLKPAEKKPVLSTYKRSRESLELELNAHGFNVVAPEDMENTLASYQAFESAKDVHSRYENPAQGTAMERQIRLKNWAEGQPDYFEENYLEFGDVCESPEDYEAYTAPFHPAVKSMRVLVVRDGVFGVGVLYEAARQMPAKIKIYRADTLAQAQDLLSRQHYDIILTDFVLDGRHNGFELAMYVWDNKLATPVISYSATPLNPRTLFDHNIVGAIPVVTFPDEAEKALNYLSNVAATGRAFPNPAAGE